MSPHTTTGERWAGRLTPRRGAPCHLCHRWRSCSERHTRAQRLRHLSSIAHPVNVALGLLCLAPPLAAGGGIKKIKRRRGCLSLSFCVFRALVARLFQKIMKRRKNVEKNIYATRIASINGINVYCVDLHYIFCCDNTVKFYSLALGVKGAKGEAGPSAQGRRKPGRALRALPRRRPLPGPSALGAGAPAHVLIETFRVFILFSIGVMIRSRLSMGEDITFPPPLFSRRGKAGARECLLLIKTLKHLNLRAQKPRPPPTFSFFFFYLCFITPTRALKY